MKHNYGFKVIKTEQKNINNNNNNTFAQQKAHHLLPGILLH